MPLRTIEAEPERWKEIGAYVVARREAFEMDQKEFVGTSNVSQSVISKIENGKPQNNRVTVVNLRKLSKALVMYPDALMDMTVQSIEDVERKNAQWWADVEAAGGVEEFYDDLGTRDLDPGHRLARLELRVSAIERHLGLDPETVQPERDDPGVTDDPAGT